MDAEFNRKLNEIKRLLAEAYEHYFEHGDGGHKSSEGAISIHYPAFFWWEDQDQTPSIEIYSYVLGPHRNHYFKNINAALRAVRAWHKAEMEFDHEAAEAEWEEAMVSLNE